MTDRNEGERNVKSIVRLAGVAAITTTVSLATCTTASATEYGNWSHDLGAYVSFETVGDHLYITDKVANGHSAIGVIDDGTQYYYWNRNGQGTTRHVNLDLLENKAIALGAVEGDWQGTATGGIIWGTLSTRTIMTS
ncbi:hypothetical protein [Streptomyces sp. NPDC054962]